MAHKLHKKNIYNKSRSQLRTYHSKLTRSNIITIIIGVIVFVIIIACGVWKYSKSTNNYTVSKGPHISNNWSNNNTKKIPNRLCGTYAYNLNNNKYYHIVMLWHLTPTHVFRQLVVVPSTQPNNSKLKQQQAVWKAQKNLKKYKKQSHNMQKRINRIHNARSRQKSQNQLNAYNIHHGIFSSTKKNNRSHNKQKRVATYPASPQEPQHVVTNKKPVIPSNVQTQMKHISSLLENYNTMYDVRHVSVGDTIMHINLYMNTQVVGKYNKLLSHYTNVKEVNMLSPKVNNNTIKLFGNNIIYDGKTFEHISQNIAHQILKNNNLTQYWAGY